MPTIMLILLLLPSVHLKAGYRSFLRVAHWARTPCFAGPPRDKSGFLKFFSSGNEADLNSADYLEYLSQDAATQVVMIYLEGVKDGRKFLEALRKTCRVKPVVIMKGGETAAGARAVESHTGVLAGSDAVFSAACKQAGATRVYDADELFDIAMTFAGQTIPRGKNVGLVTGAGGGMGVIAADACAKLGLSVPPFSEETVARLRNILPAYAPVKNPVI